MVYSARLTFDGAAGTISAIVHHQIAMIPDMKDGSSMTFGCRLEAINTLILTPQYDKMVIPGMKIAPLKDEKMSYEDLAERYKFKRLE